MRNGQASVTATLATSGTHAIFANYSGDSVYPDASGLFGQVVNRVAGSLTVTSSVAAPVSGQTVTFTAQIGPPPPAGVPYASGPIQFLDGPSVIGTGTLSSGVATLNVASLAVGAHQIAAFCPSDDYWYAMKSPSVSLTVNPVSTSTVLTVAPTLMQATLTATVAVNPPGSGAPPGSVQFRDTTTNAALGTVELAGKTVANMFIDASQAVAMAGHSIRAVYSGSPNYASSSSDAMGVPAMVSGTGSPSSHLAADQMVSLFGYQLADTTVQAGTVPLPESLAGAVISVKDSAGVTRLAGLSSVSPARVDFVMPSGIAPGTAIVTFTNAGAKLVVGPMQVPMAPVAPGLFPAAQLIRVHTDGTQTLESVSASAIAMGSDATYLVLYVTGIRNRLDHNNVTCTIAGQSLPVTYAGPQLQFPGLDQVDVLLPASLKGAGQVRVSITADGVVSNDIALMFQ